jgi:hypothetical protein
MKSCRCADHQILLQPASRVAPVALKISVVGDELGDQSVEVGSVFQLCPVAQRLNSTRREFAMFDVGWPA